MTIAEKFHQILSVLPDNGSEIKVDNAPLCPGNPWSEFYITRMFKETNGGCDNIRYRTPGGLWGSINLYEMVLINEFERDINTLYAWMYQRGYFGHIDRNLF